MIYDHRHNSHQILYATRYQNIYIGNIEEYTETNSIFHTKMEEAGALSGRECTDPTHNLITVELVCVGFTLEKISSTLLKLLVSGQFPFAGTAILQPTASQYQVTDLAENYTGRNKAAALGRGSSTSPHFSSWQKAVSFLSTSFLN